MMNKIRIALVVAAMICTVRPATADSFGTDTSASAIGTPALIEFTGSCDLDMDQNLTGVGTIRVLTGVDARIDFNAGTTNHTITFLNTGAAIDIQGSGTLTIVAGGSSAGFTFGAATGQTLTVNNSIAGGVINGNKFTIGNNTLQLTAAATMSGTVVIGGAGAVLDIDASTTIARLEDGGSALTIDIAISTTATVTTPVLTGDTTLNGVSATTSILEIDSFSTIADLTITGQALFQADASLILTNFDNSGAVNTFDIANGVAIVISNPTMAGTTLVRGVSSSSILSLSSASTVANLITANTCTLNIAAPTLFTAFSVGSGSTPTIDADASVGITTLSVPAGDDLAFDIADNITAGVTNAVTLSGDSVLNVIASGGGNDDILLFSGGLSLAGTSTLRFTNDTGRVNGGVTFGADGVTIDVDGNAEVQTLTPSNSGTIDIADGKQLSVDNSVTVATGKTLTYQGTTGAASETLTFTGGLVLGSGSGATLLTTGDTANAMIVTGAVGALGNSTVDINASTNVPQGVFVVSATVDVAAGMTLTGTVSISSFPLLLRGTGTISRLDSTTGQIFDFGGVTVADLRPLPSGGTAAFHVDTGITTTVSMTNGLTGAGDTFQKVGSGTLVVAGGLKESLDNAAGVVIDINAGTVQVGTSASDADNIIDLDFDDDGDMVTVDGATLTTFGDVNAAAGGNSNLQVAADAIINLSASAARSLTAVKNDDFLILGTTNINGTNCEYTLNGAFLYQFGDINISPTGSLMYNTPNGKIDFSTVSQITIQGNATLNLGSSTDGNEIVLDTIGDAAYFIIDRNSTATLTLNHVSLSRATYISGTGCTADFDGINLTTVDFATANQNWIGTCPGFSGSGGTTTDTGPKGQSEETIDDSGEPSDPKMPTGSDDPPAVDPESPGTVTTVGTESKTNVEGLDNDTPVMTTVDKDGGRTITVGDPESPRLKLQLNGFDSDATINLTFDDMGGSMLVIQDRNGNPLQHLSMTGFEQGTTVALETSADGSRRIVLQSDRSTVSLNLRDLPDGTELNVTHDETEQITVEVFDPTGQRADVSITTAKHGGIITFDIQYDDTTAGNTAARVVPGVSGLRDGLAYGGTVTIDAATASIESIYLVSLMYDDKDVFDFDERELRLHRYDDIETIFVPAGDNDVGVNAPTGLLGDYGVETESNGAWSETDQLGRFAIGRPIESLTEDESGAGDQVENMQDMKDNDEPPPPSAAPPDCGGGVCGVLGVIYLPVMILGLIGLKRTAGHRRRFEQLPCHVPTCKRRLH
jgi:hypothetical protein